MFTTDDDAPVEHDELWKEAIEEFIVHFIRYFFPDADAQFDLTAEIVFMESELNALLRDASGSNRRADKLVRVTTKDGSYRWLYIHIEVQGYADPDFDLRMYTMHYRLFEKYGPNVTSLALITDGSSNYRPGHYEHECFGTQLIFKYPTLKLKDVDPAVFENSKNPIAIILYTAWMYLQSEHADNDQILTNKLTLLRQIKRLGLTEKEEVLVVNFIRYYIKFKKFDRSRFKLKFEEGVKVELQTPRNMGMTDMLRRTAIEFGEARGEARGRAEGEARGEARGIEKEKLATARNCIQLGYENAAVSQITGLSIAQVTAIRAELP